ncbi:MAG: tetratricopeptide repeat protein, partial [Gammaproteobacteria bacterium]
MALIDMPVTDKAGNVDSHKVRPRDVNIFALQSAGMSCQDQIVSGMAVNHIKVDAKTVFTVTATRPCHKKLFNVSMVILLAMITIAAPAMYSLYAGSPPDTVVMPEAALQLESAGIAAASSDMSDSYSTETGHNSLLSDNHANASPQKTNSTYGSAVIETTSYLPVDNNQSEEEPATTGMENTLVGMAAETGARPEPPATETMPGVAAGTLVTIPRNTEHDIHAEPNGINIINGKSADNIAVLVNDAYAAYTSGRYSVALQGYHDVLAEMPDNRDALLGVAAIAQRMGAPEKALQIYLKIFENIPDDPAAAVGLMNITGGRYFQENIQAIGKLLKDYPHVSYLYFYLGTLHADANHWLEARDAFFEACRLENANP